ncbi:hypothetical protein C7974DRAFT_332454 [Boeremia exigua]|uniref:uncharacterized protein n=1 Tax=Boeremia exigua TaxID=749465 RepID=UPI001E8D58FD|nr:uncharacterized protein C7974DRAFT_332454 [Boeremia exigua]KAH6637799.1 hypothetical protein C7974DRAFT_332454 [Boeremia exigua]
MAGGYLNQLWGDSELPPERPRYLPLAGTFSDEGPGIPGTESHHLEFPLGLPHSQPFDPSEQLFQHPTPLIPLSAVEDLHAHEPYISSTFQDPFNRAFASNQPVVHEGYIPAPGTRDEDLYPNLPDGYRESLFQDYDESSDESDFDRRLAEAEELREIEEKDNPEVDADYSEEEAEQDEGDPNEMEIDESYVEERARPKAKRGGRGGRRGRPAGRAQGGFQGPTRKQLRGKKKAGRPSGKRGPRAIADPGPDFKRLQRAANERFIARDYSAALVYGQKAVQLNPEIFDAHNLVAECYAAMGEELNSIESLIIGAPTKRDPELWHLIIERIKRLDTTEHPTYTDEVKTAVVLQCLKSIIALDVTNYEARSLKLEIEARLGHVSKCVNLGTKMLKTLREQKQDPDTEVLKIMAMMGTSTSKQTKRHLPKIIEEFDQAIEVFTGPGRDPKTSDLDWELINIYLDLVDRTGDYDHGLKRLKDLSRWKQGRRNETFWDEEKDDREFDIDDEPRRVEVFDFKRKSESAKYGETLPLEIRVKMGLFRLRRSADDYDEAMYHLQMLEPDDKSSDALMWDYLDLFRVIADALHSTGHDTEALRFYEPLLESNSSEMSLMSYLGLYTVYKNLGQPERAEQIIPILVGWTADTVDDLAVLAKFFEVHDMPQEAMERADACYRNRGLVKLRRIGYSRLREIRSHYEDWRRKSRGNHGKKKDAMKKQRKLMRRALADADDDDDDEDDDGNGERPSLAPPRERPAKGLFRTKRTAPKPPKTQTFLPFDLQAQQESSTLRSRILEPKHLEGTDVPMDAIDHRIFRKKLQKLAEDNADDLTAARAQHREIVASFQKLDDLYDAAEDGDEEAISTVLSITRELIEEFSTFDLFYADKKEDFKGYFRRIGAGDFWKESALMMLAVVANNVEDGETSPELRERPDVAPTDFWGVHFDTWCDAFARYALLMARTGDASPAFSTLDIGLASNIFARHSDYTHTLQLTRLAAALALDDSTQASSAIRWLLREHPFGSDLFRLYSCANRLTSAPAGYATGPAHKVLMRYIKTTDFALLPPAQRPLYNFRANRARAHAGVNATTLPAVRGHDPALFALYAHVLIAGGSYMAALNYYFRAYALVPHDPVLNLAIGTAYIQHAMKRLSENRQFQIQQGLSFVHRYYELRLQEGRAVLAQEAEFNVGRVWHALGLVGHALQAYERCVGLSGRVREEAEAEGGRDGGWEDFSTEAAFAMQSIYAVSGNVAAAQQVTREVLVIE